MYRNYNKEILLVFAIAFVHPLNHEIKCFHVFASGRHRVAFIGCRTLCPERVGSRDLWWRGGTMRPKQHVTWPGTSQLRLVLTLTSGGSSRSDHQARHWSRVVHAHAWLSVSLHGFFGKVFEATDALETSEAFEALETFDAPGTIEAFETFGTVDGRVSKDCGTTFIRLLWLFSLYLLAVGAFRDGLVLLTPLSVEFLLWCSVSWASDRSNTSSRLQQYFVMKGQGNHCKERKKFDNHEDTFIVLFTDCSREWKGEKRGNKSWEKIYINKKKSALL